MLRGCGMAMALVLLAGCTRPGKPAEKPAALVPGAPADAGPTRPDAAPATYVGAASCAACHGEEHEAWSHDWHARALSPATASSVAGNFRGAHFRGSSSEAWMKQVGGKDVMRTAGADGGVGEFVVDRVIGGKRMQDALTTFDDGRWQILPVYFHVTGKRWVDYTEAKQGALTPRHPYFWTNLRRTANRECLDCHATGVDVRYDGATHRWTTRVADEGVGCEACHGPGSRHVESQDAAAIFQPAKAPPALGLAACAQCHGPRNPLFPLLDAEHRFRPGDDYDASYQALVLTDGVQRSGDFFADGRPRTSSFEYQALVQSQCFMKGGATCLSCHTAPHAKHGEDELAPSVKAAAIGDASCAGCHAQQVAHAAEHSHHREAAAQRCTACHMPKVLSGVLDPFADHALDVPNPLTTAAHGVPNACATCHAREKPEPLQAKLLAWWPDARARQARRSRLADAFDETTAAQSLASLQATIADSSEAPTLRAAASELLARRFPAEASRTLVPVLHDGATVLRSKAARALAVARDPRSADALATLLDDPQIWVRQAAAVALMIRGDRRGAPAVYALAHDPRTEGLPTPHELLAQLARSRGDLDGAEAELRTAIRLQPFAPESHLLLSEIELQRREPDAARLEAEEALRLDPSNERAQKRLASLPR